LISERRGKVRRGENSGTGKQGGGLSPAVEKKGKILVKGTFLKGKSPLKSGEYTLNAKNQATVSGTKSLKNEPLPICALGEKTSEIGGF